MTLTGFDRPTCVTLAKALTEMAQLAAAQLGVGTASGQLTESEYQAWCKLLAAAAQGRKAT